MNIDGYKVETRPITVLEYQQLRNTTDWHLIKDEQVEKALHQDLFSVVVIFDAQVVGMGRVIGDGAIYYYIQDVIIHPDHRGQGLGRLIMGHIESFLSRSIKNYAFIGLMAAEGTEAFYTSFGYSKRKDDSPGMFKVIGD